MALSEDLINFDLIESHKENIQQLPGGRSAKQLVLILSPPPSSRTGALPSLDETKTLNDALRQEYENELLSIADSDDPLDIYDRYVKWTFNAYPSAQATPQSQLLPLLERATKTFLTSSHYKNDPRYLKLWLHYIRLFDDTPRETFAFLARHHIGEGLGLFYEEFAAWLEGAERWNQADEVYKMGIEREARPAERLMRKYNQFKQRYDARPQNDNEPSSPALPTVRPALAAKIDPFATRSEDSPAQRPASGGSTAKPKSGKPKMAIFSDADNQTPPPSNTATKGWDSIGFIKERKKENTIEARPWTGETLKASKRVGTVPKMEIFKDSKPQTHESKQISINSAHVVNPRTGRSERVFVKLEAIYPPSGEEFSFEELRAINRGWMNKDWTPILASPMRPSSANVTSPRKALKSTDPIDIENFTESFRDKVEIHDSSSPSIVDLPESKPIKQKRLKVREVKQETQTVKARLDSPTGRKIKRKGSAEPTMTLHSKVATNDIYDIFNQPSKPVSKQDTQSGGEESDFGDDTYSTAGESVGTGRMSANNSEFGDDTTRSFNNENMSSQPESVSPWSDFTTSKHVPGTKKNQNKHKRAISEDLTDQFDSSQNQTMNMGAFDTQAIAAIADQDFGDMDTKMIARLAGDEEAEEIVEDTAQSLDNERHNPEEQPDENDLKTPVDDFFSDSHPFEVQQEPRFVPIPPEGYEPTPVRPYRDPAFAAQNKLPFMTPIVERTESSLAPSTVFQDSEYFATKTPSRSAPIPINDIDSPSKLHLNNLLLGSPQEQKSISAVKRRRSVDLIDIPEEVETSPSKKQNLEIFRDENQKIPFTLPKAVEKSVVKVTNVVDEFCKIPDPHHKVSTKSQPIHKGPIVLDLQCNPCDPIIQEQILNSAYPPISSYRGFNQQSSQIFNHHAQLKSFAKKEKSTKSSPRKTLSDRTLTKAVPPILKFADTNRVYALKKELGKGAYAPVYLVDSYDPAAIGDVDDELDDPSQPQPDGSCRGALEAVKTESPPVSLSWEFHILRLLKSRLGSSARAMMSIITAHECHLYRDECYLILDYHSQGTVLDLVNHVKTDNSRAGKTVEGLEETVAMWLSVELLRTMEEFHKVGILHGDLKADNCLVRFEPGELAGPYDCHGNDGWNAKGMMLIDFGRGIDTRAFKPEARFVADWTAEETDCAEIREARPWKWELDLFGAAGVIHSLLFGKYIETVAINGGGGGGGLGLGQKKEWKLKESFKRYWERDIWAEVFHVLINNGGAGGGKDEDVRREVARVRGLMEDWLESEGERGGRDLRGGIRRCERLIGVSSISASGGGGGRGKGR